MQLCSASLGAAEMGEARAIHNVFALDLPACRATAHSCARHERCAAAYFDTCIYTLRQLS
jgi:hypothetical protein